jgi:hypothetical protein
MRLTNLRNIEDAAHYQRGVSKQNETNRFQLVSFNKCQYIICVPVGGAFFTFKQMKKVSKAKQDLSLPTASFQLNTELNTFNEN